MTTVTSAPEAPGPRIGPAAVPPSLRIGRRRFPVVLPSIKDPRLHLAAVIISIHILGQTELGFRVSVAQILIAILTCAVIEVTWTAVKTGQLVWPASAMLTGSGVALIFRVIGTENGDYWSTNGWYLFAIVAGASLLTKYLIQYRGSHVFNPSNVGLVVAFIVLGSGRVEPLDFWWAPFGVWMAAAYAIILVGGVLITRRLHLLVMSTAFWITLAAGLGVLAASGHCMTARWAFAPVCGAHFWWVIVLSPEILIFLFFMITDPKTVPAGRVARIVFAACVAVTSVLLIAPQTTEFGAKVALLSGLVILCVARLVFERFLPVARSEEDGLGVFAGRLAREGTAYAGPRRAFGRGAIAGAAVVFLAAAVVAAGIPARTPLQEASAAAAPPEITVHVDPATLPAVSVDAAVADVSRHLAGPGAQDLAATLAENLQVENEALANADPRLLAAVDYGRRLDEMRRRIDESVATGATIVGRYVFDSLHLVTIPREGQVALSLGIEARGSLEQTTYDSNGDRTGRSTRPFALTFVVSQPVGDRWLIVDTLPLP